MNETFIEVVENGYVINIHKSSGDVFSDRKFVCHSKKEVLNIMECYLDEVSPSLYSENSGK
jgi:hypothetical protein